MFEITMVWYGMFYFMLGLSSPLSRALGRTLVTSVRPLINLYIIQNYHSTNIISHLVKNSQWEKTEQGRPKLPPNAKILLQGHILSIWFYKLEFYVK